MLSLVETISTSLHTTVLRNLVRSLPASMHQHVIDAVSSVNHKNAKPATALLRKFTENPTTTEAGKLASKNMFQGDVGRSALERAVQDVVAARPRKGLLIKMIVASSKLPSKDQEETSRIATELMQDAELLLGTIRQEHARSEEACLTFQESRELLGIVEDKAMDFWKGVLPRMVRFSEALLMMAANAGHQALLARVGTRLVPPLPKRTKGSGGGDDEDDEDYEDYEDYNDGEDEYYELGSDWAQRVLGRTESDPLTRLNKDQTDKNLWEALSDTHRPEWGDQMERWTWLMYGKLHARAEAESATRKLAERFLADTTLHVGESWKFFMDRLGYDWDHQEADIHLAKFCKVVGGIVTGEDSNAAITKEDSERQVQAVSSFLSQTSAFKNWGF